MPERRVSVEEPDSSQGVGVLGAEGVERGRQQVAQHRNHLAVPPREAENSTARSWVPDLRQPAASEVPNHLATLEPSDPVAQRLRFVVLGEQEGEEVAGDTQLRQQALAFQGAFFTRHGFHPHRLLTQGTPEGAHQELVTDSPSRLPPDRQRRRHPVVGSDPGQRVHPAGGFEQDQLRDVRKLAGLRQPRRISVEHPPNELGSVIGYPLPSFSRTQRLATLGEEALRFPCQSALHGPALTAHQWIHPGSRQPVARVEPPDATDCRGRVLPLRTSRIQSAYHRSSETSFPRHPSRIDHLYLTLSDASVWEWLPFRTGSSKLHRGTVVWRLFAEKDQPAQVLLSERLGSTKPEARCQTP